MHGRDKICIQDFHRKTCREDQGVMGRKFSNESVSGSGYFWIHPRTVPSLFMLSSRVDYRVFNSNFVSNSHPPHACYILRPSLSHTDEQTITSCT
jgi:hypothetical protein